MITEPDNEHTEHDATGPMPCRHGHIVRKTSDCLICSAEWDALDDLGMRE